MKLIVHPNIRDESAFFPTMFKLDESEAMNKGELL